MKTYLKYIPLALFTLVIGGSAFGKLAMAAPLTESFAALGYPAHGRVQMEKSAMTRLNVLFCTQPESIPI